VKALKPKVILFSGGGNDVAGEPLLGFLNHADSGLPELRMRIVEDSFHTSSRKAIADFVRLMIDASPGCVVLHHGYGYPLPNGARVKVLWGWGELPFVGPWMKNQFDKRRIPFARARAHMGVLIDEFNKMQSQLEVEFAATGPHGAYKHIDFRGVINDDDWSDEMHLKPSAYAKCADVLAARIRAIVQPAGLATSVTPEGVRRAYWPKPGKGKPALPKATKGGKTEAVRRRKPK
jgi:hypothetical protein